MERLLSISELCDLIGARRQTIYKWVHEKRIPFLKPGGKLVRFRASDIERWLEGRKKSGKRGV